MSCVCAIVTQGPRSSAQRPHSQFWNEHFTTVQLRYEFISSANYRSLTLDRTYLTFYDFDAGHSQVVGATPAMEIVQIGTQAIAVELPTDTELVRRTSWSQIGLSSQALAMAHRMPTGGWESPILYATAYGTGHDNPMEPYAVTELQSRRSFIAMLEATSFLQVRYAIGACVPLDGTFGP